MSKRQLSPTEAFELRQALHIATLDALMASQRWNPGELVFQGGTSLHLAHGSPRFSEDLDFLVSDSLNLAPIAASVCERLSDLGWLPDDAALTVGKTRDGRNPYSFVVSIGGENIIGSVRVKVELWQTNGRILSGLQVVVAPVRLARGALAGMQTFVPTAELAEIHADKV
ncbi:MAG: nucleotidyl transferase AbiEii/AbiGii toxin family protein, partial [Zoogloeaceae bacterium]|nr:nucleotidyl transferase AbiEii/AbiGii toxin family protein [Zoogloeaceae bacterium]